MDLLKDFWYLFSFDGFILLIIEELFKAIKVKDFLT